MFEGLLPTTKKQRRKPVGLPPPATRAEGNAVLRKEIGRRLVEARNINGWDQTEAATKLGYRNSTQLSLAEQGKRLPPHEILIRASVVYGVSMDFIFSMSDEPERDPKAAERNAAMRHVQDLITQTTNQQIAMLMQYLAHGVPSIRTAQRLLAVAQTLADEVQRTQQINGKVFSDKLKNGAKLVSAADETARACADAAEMLTRHERLMEFKTRIAENKAGVTHPLFDVATQNAEARTQ